MRRFIVFLVLALSLCAARAESQYKVYAELLGFQKGLFSRKAKVRVDFGQNVSFWKQGEMMLVDENGKDIVFNSMVDAMNFMGKCGWQFEQAYVVTEGNQNVYHWLLSKMVANDDQIKEGFNVRADLLEAEEPQYVLSYLKKRKTSKQWDLVKTETKKVSQDEINVIIENWKSQSNENYDYDCQIKKY